MYIIHAHQYDAHFFCLKYRMFFNDFIHSQLLDQPHYLLIGNPVGHSVSPLMHNLALNYHNLNTTYFSVSVEKSDLTQLAAHLNTSTFLGANITIPYKEILIPFMDELTTRAQNIGAINTIIKKGNLLVGENTDVYGFNTPLHHIEELEPSRAIIFGTGGATKAIIYALNDFGFNEVCVVSRNPNSIIHNYHCTVCTYHNWQYFSEDASLIINATPLGMMPSIDTSPIKNDEIEFLDGKICYDIVYNPIETKFLQQAKKINAMTIGGLEMLIHQGDKSFFEWTGKGFPLPLVKTKLHEHFRV